ncbi:MAG: ATP-binding cassette domain-containing protein, partial [Syntrophothermus sp.]
MKFYEFLRKESDKPLAKLLFLTALSGLSSAGVLAIINLAAKNVTGSSINMSYLLMFAATVGIFITSQKFILTTGIMIIEDILNNIRIRLSDKIRRTDLLNIEQIGKAEIYNRLTQECTLISQMAPYIINSLQSAIMLIFVFGYIAIISLLAAVLLIILILVGVLVFHKNNLKVYSDLEATNKAEIKFFVTITDILDGLKEIKLNRKKGNDIFSHYADISVRLKDLKIGTGYKFSENMVFSQAFIYIILGAIVFVLPKLKPDLADQIVSTTTAMLFAIGPLTSIVSMLPVFGKVDIAIKNIYGLESELDQQLNPDEVQPINGDNRFKGFNKIQFSDLYFEYHNGGNRDAFSVGPINLEISRGEVIFIIGGNGSGKTTFLKSLTMLYKPKTG